MKLLTFAHRGEAQCFISHFQFEPVDFYFNGLFKSEHSFLLLTDEGPQSASEKTVATLSAFKNEIDEVINLGVAGSLSAKWKKDQCLWIRTAFAHHALKLEFKSFSSSYENSKVDCLTVYQRVLEVELKEKLSAFADLVDRELWAVASAATLFKLPFTSLKVISDDLVTNTQNTEICQVVKEEAFHFSNLLLKEYLTKANPNKKKVLKNSHPFSHDEAFYFTTTQERKLKSLLNGLQLKKIEIPKELIEDLRARVILPKERSRLLLIELNDLLNPFAKKMRLAIEKSVAPLTQAGISFQYNPNFEQSLLHLNISINSERDVEKVKNALKIFSFGDYKKIFEGDLDDV